MADLSLRAALLVAAGGAAGSVLRFAAGAWLSRPGWPWGTLAVNLAGSFLIGLLLFGVLARPGSDARLLLATGLLGGFTTMSSFAHETSVLLDEGNAWRAAAYVLATVAGCLALAMAGRSLGRLFV